MVITKEMKERFVKMLYDHHIIVIQCKRGSNYKRYNYKFIGADAHGRWDFTPMCAELSGYPNNSSTHIEYLSIRALDGVAVLTDVLEKIIPLKENESRYSRYQEVRDRLATYYI